MREPGIGIQRDNVAHAGWQFVKKRRFDKAGIGGAAQQPIEFVQLAALALPAHPASLAGVPGAPAVQQQKADAARRRAIA